MRKLSVVFLVMLLALSAGAQQKIAVGIMPVFDASGDLAGELLSQHLTVAIYDELRGSNVEPVLLAPGAVFLPTDKEWAIEYGRQAGVNAVLVSALQPSNRPKKGDWTIRVQTELIDVATGNSSPSTMHTEQVGRVHLNFIDSGMVDVTGSQVAASRPFEKQELGKKSRKLGESIRAYTVSASAAVKGTAPLHATGGARCKTDFRIAYPNQANSFAYSLIVNKRDETLFIKDGVASFELPSGPVLLQVKLQDAPYKLPVHRQYQVSTYADCSKPARTLTMTIGPAGEALLSWQ